MQNGTLQQLQGSRMQVGGCFESGNTRLLLQIAWCDRFGEFSRTSVIRDEELRRPLRVVTESVELPGRRDVAVASLELNGDA